ncbi:hypothetical protein C0993_007036 [Termitomyces sp. T159_Od127]|nr:hypothetical protein C0993_007036 [Termitomyces sp. T159_Od127]
MIESLPPPTYSQTDPDEGPTDQADPIVVGGPQILIVPTGDSVNFQKGFLGAEGERAAIEGELQVKTTEPDQWAKVTISLRTVERAEEQEIELATSENVLYARILDTPNPFPTSFPFAIPLQTDAPQSIRTSNSSLSYFLTATLHPSDPHLPPFSKTLIVHTRRYTSHSHVVPVHPETYILEDPTRVEVQVPRITFVAGETIPVYVTVPPPVKELVVDQALRLRNVRVELTRIVKVVKGDSDESMDGASQSGLQESLKQETETDGPSMTSGDRLSQTLPSKSPLFHAPVTHRMTIARSGASCRFHSSRPVRLRFLLNHPLSTGSPSSSPNDLSSTDYRGQYESDEECPSVTQLTIFHSITFCLFVYVSFVDITSRRERISTLSIPITILAPPAPLPQVSPEFDAAYSKKHDRPPLRTVRHDDGDHSVPHYSEGEAGPSVLPNNEPPPFEERDAPPPFSLDDTGNSSSSRLPTFLESEEEIIIPTDQGLDRPQSSLEILGEGFDFGFLPSDQFDGHAEPIQRSMTPPPTLEMATRDTNLTDLADLADMGQEPQMAIEALGLALGRHEESVAGERPPPPPAMDDPADPPPTIDSDFRSPDISGQTPPPHTGSSQLPTFTPEEHRAPVSLPEREPAQIHGYAPPPYLVPVRNPNEQENVTRPPPYMD